MTRASQPSGEVATQHALAVHLVRRLGLPAAALADILGVDRTSVYEWLDGPPMSGGAQGSLERMRILLEACSGEVAGSMRYFHRFCDRDTPVGRLRDLLMAPELVARDISLALDSLRPAVLRSQAADASREPGAGASPAGSLTIHLVVGAKR